MDLKVRSGEDLSAIKPSGSRQNNNEFILHVHCAVSPIPLIPSPAVRCSRQGNRFLTSAGTDNYWINAHPIVFRPIVHLQYDKDRDSAIEHIKCTQCRWIDFLVLILKQHFGLVFIGGRFYSPLDDLWVLYEVYLLFYLFTAVKGKFKGRKVA